MSTRIAISILLMSCSLTVLASPADTPLQRGEEIGRYIGATRGAQQLTYRVLDYCAETNPTKHENVAKAKEEWNKRNLALVTSWREVARNWLMADQVAEADIPSTIIKIDAMATTMLEALKPAQEEAVKVLAAKSPEEQTKTCALFVGFVIGGGRDIRVTSPTAMQIYERYAPTTHNPAVADENVGTIVGAFETTLTGQAGSLKLRLECETEAQCKLTNESQPKKSLPTKDVQVFNEVRPVEKLGEAASALRYAIDKRSTESRNEEYAELMHRLGPTFSSNPSLARCWDLTYPIPGYSLACTLSNVPENTYPVFLFFKLMANCGDVFCGYVIYPLSRLQ